MRIKEGFNLRRIGNEYIVIPGGKDSVDFTTIISLNESAARLWQEIAEREFSVEEMGKLLLQWYDIDEKTAHADACALGVSWINAGVAEE